jgi:hypothetical protein
MVGGIGSCGLELCCTTWLPEFVPGLDQDGQGPGLVLNPPRSRASAAGSSAAWSTSRRRTPSCARASPSSASA